MSRSKLSLGALLVLPALVFAAVGTWIVGARSLDIGFEPTLIFAVLFLGALLGVAVVYYAFRLDVEASR